MYKNFISPEEHRNNIIKSIIENADLLADQVSQGHKVILRRSCHGMRVDYYKSTHMRLKNRGVDDEQK